MTLSISSTPAKSLKRAGRTRKILDRAPNFEGELGSIIGKSVSPELRFPLYSRVQ